MIEELLLFFTDDGDWSYVMDYKRYGIVSAMITNRHSFYETDRKRIVIQLQGELLFSVVRIGTTPQGSWEACRLDRLGEKLLGDPDHYTTSELFDTFFSHASKP